MATTTQRTEAGYLAARAAYYDAQAVYYEAAAAKYDADPDITEVVREDMVSYYRAAAENERALAEADRVALKSECVCGGVLARIGDAPCPRCAPALSPSEAKELLGAMGHEVAP